MSRARNRRDRHTGQDRAWEGRSAVVQTREPHSGLPRLAFKVGAGGFAWIKARLEAEVTNPTTRMGQTIHALTRRGLGAVSALPRSVRRSLVSGKDPQLQN